MSSGPDDFNQPPVSLVSLFMIILLLEVGLIVLWQACKHAT